MNVIAPWIDVLILPYAKRLKADAAPIKYYFYFFHHRLETVIEFLTAHFPVGISRFEAALLVVGVAENSAPQAILPMKLVGFVNLLGVVVAINYLSIIAPAARRSFAELFCVSQIQALEGNYRFLNVAIRKKTVRFTCWVISLCASSGVMSMSWIRADEISAGSAFEREILENINSDDMAR